MNAQKVKELAQKFRTSDYSEVDADEATLHAAIDALQAKCDRQAVCIKAARKDAERYQRLRKPNANIDVCIRDYDHDHGMTGRLGHTAVMN